MATLSELEICTADNNNISNQVDLSIAPGTTMGKECEPSKILSAPALLQNNCAQLGFDGIGVQSLPSSPAASRRAALDAAPKHGCLRRASSHSDSRLYKSVRFVDNLEAKGS